MSVFSPSIRVVLCLHCPGMVQAPYEGGVARCDRCGNPVTLGARDARPLGADRALPEHERLSRLRAQDGRPRQLPPSVQALAPFGEIEAWKIREAFEVWAATRQEVLRTGGFEAAERLVLLTMLLCNHLGDQAAEMVRRRALFESALDVVTLPRHRQMLRGQLCRGAVRVGDLDGAEHWLRPCDPRSEDLETDTAYRLSRACIDSARHRYAEVLEVLGRDPAEVPIQDAADAVCAVLRANAWERLGYAPRAVELLQRAMRELGPQGRRAMSMSIAANQHLGLCPASFALAERQHAVHASGAAVGMAGGGIGKVLGSAGVGVIATGVLSALGFGAFGFAGGIEGLVSAAIGVVVCLATCVPTGLWIIRWGRSMDQEATRAGRLQAQGVPARARVLSVTPTGTQVNDTPQMNLDLEVHLAGKSPYQARARSFVPLTALPMLVPGAHVAVRVDPQDPTAVAREAA